jgi:hypothetical protein
MYTEFLRKEILVELELGGPISRCDNKITKDVR